MSMRKRPILAAAGSIAFLIIGTATMILWLNNRPRWELSAANTDEGLRIEIFKQNDTTPTYATVLDGHQLSRRLNRVTLDELPADIGKTTFTDETLKPGRWTLILDGVEIDVMPTRLIIDRETEVAPAE